MIFPTGRDSNEPLSDYRHRVANDLFSATSPPYPHVTNSISCTRHSQTEITVSDDALESYQFPSHQLELPFVLVQDSIAGLELVDRSLRVVFSKNPAFQEQWEED